MGILEVGWKALMDGIGVGAVYGTGIVNGKSGDGVFNGMRLCDVGGKWKEIDQFEEVEMRGDEGMVGEMNVLWDGQFEDVLVFVVGQLLF